MESHEIDRLCLRYLDALDHRDGDAARAIRLKVKNDPEAILALDEVLDGLIEHVLDPWPIEEQV